jgi:hypothetical protein
MVPFGEKGIAFCDYSTMNLNGGIIKKIDVMPISREWDICLKEKPMPQPAFKGYIISKIKEHDCPINYSAIIGLKKYFEGKFGFWDKARLGEDLHHLALICGEDCIYYVPELLLKYRWHDKNTTNRNLNNIQQNNQRIFEDLRNRGINV